MRSILPQAESSKSACAHSMLSPVWNFHGPVSSMDDSPSVTCMGGGTGFGLNVGAPGALTVVAGVEWTEAPGVDVVPAFVPGVTVHSIISNVNPARRIKLLSLTVGFKHAGDRLLLEADHRSAIAGPPTVPGDKL